LITIVPPLIAAQEAENFGFQFLMLTTRNGSNRLVEATDKEQALVA
jgi:hypothetical protein